MKSEYIKLALSWKLLISCFFLFCFNFLPDIPEDADYLLQFTIQTIQRKQFTQ